MTGFAVIDEERPTPLAIPAPRAFRFSDANPLTSGTYAQSRFRDLPEYAALVVENRLHLCAGEWDVLVGDGEVFDFVGPRETFVIAPAGPDGVPCGKCLGEGRRCVALGRWITCPACQGRKVYAVISEADTREVERQERAAYVGRHGVDLRGVA